MATQRRTARKRKRSPRPWQFQRRYPGPSARSYTTASTAPTGGTRRGSWPSKRRSGGCGERALLEGAASFPSSSLGEAILLLPFLETTMALFAPRLRFRGRDRSTGGLETARREGTLPREQASEAVRRSREAGRREVAMEAALLPLRGDERYSRLFLLHPFSNFFSQM